MKQPVLICFLVVGLVSLVNGLAIDLSKSIEDVEALLGSLKAGLDTNMKRDEIGLKNSCRDAPDCGKNPGRPKQMCHMPDIKQNCPHMCGGRCGGSEDRLEELISYLKAEVDGEK